MLSPRGARYRVFSGRPSTFRGAGDSRRLDAITNESVQRLKHTLRGKAPKTVNNVLTVLNGLLKTAAEWEIIEQIPCTIRLLRVPKTSASFHDFDDFERLVDTAREADWQTHLIVLLGGEAGAAVRRDDGVGMVGCGPGQAPTAHLPV